MTVFDLTTSLCCTLCMANSISWRAGMTGMGARSLITCQTFSGERQKARGGLEKNSRGEALDFLFNSCLHGRS